MRALYVELMEDMDVDVTFVDSMDDLRAVLNKRLPSLILVTYEGPHKLEDYCHLIRGSRLYKNIPIMLVTAREDMESRLNATRIGVDYFMYKPFSFQEMEARLQAVLRQDSIREQESLQSFLYQLGNQLPFGFVVVDEDREIISMNRNAYVYLNCREDVSQKTLSSFVSEYLKCVDSVSEEQDILNTLLNKELTYVQKKSDEEPKWFRLSATKMTWGNSNRYLIYIKDCTSQIRRQNLTWSLHSMMGHKLKTPLNGIIAPLTYLKEEPKNTPLEEVEDILEMVYTSSYRLNDTIEQMFNYVESFHCPENEIGYSVIEIPFLIESIAEDLCISVDIKDNLGEIDASINAFDCNVDAIFHELFKNASKFHPENKPHITVELSIQDNRLLIEFCDDGRHVSEENIDQLCTPFFQEENHFTGELPGVGLGLSHINQLLWSMGGSINIRNRLDKPGLVVDIHIPLQQKDFGAAD